MSAISVEFYDIIHISSSALGVLFLKSTNTEQGKVTAQALAAVAPHDWAFGEINTVTNALNLITDGLKNASRQDLVDEYNRLFVGPAKMPAPPYGSVYLDHDTILFGDSLIEMRRWMKVNNVKVKYTEREPEDHLGRMLVLTGLLADERPELLNPFLRHHFCTWSSHCLRQIEDATCQDFYHGLALLTRITLQGICKELNIVPDVKKFYR